MKGRLHHIELYVSDLEKSKMFWHWLLSELNYTLFQEWKDGVSYKLEETKSAYSRSIPFEEFDGTKLEWRNIEQSTIGFHNYSYTNVLEGIKIRELKARKSRRIVISSLGGSILIPLFFFLIRRRRKKKSTSKS